MSAQELAEIAAARGTDKWGVHRYAKHYAYHLEYLRHQPFKLLEIGVGGYADPLAGGSSLRAWKDYFTKAQISGLDFFDKKALEEDRIKIYKGSQADPVTIAEIISNNRDGFDVIIDDGSHQNEHVIATLQMLWQYVKNDGWYIIEDLQTSYWPYFGGSLSERNSPHTSMGFLKSLVDCLNWQEIHQPTYAPSNFDNTLVGIHFYHNMTFLRKGINNEGSNFLENNRIKGI